MEKLLTGIILSSTTTELLKKWALLSLTLALQCVE